MGLLDVLSGAQDVAVLTVAFRQDGNHQITVARQPTAPTYLDGGQLYAALLLYYAAKVLHAFGSGQAAKELRQHMVLSAAVLRADRFEPFTSWIDEPGECVGRLQVGRRGTLLMTTNFRVPLLQTNNYALDSVLLVFSCAVENQPTAEDRSRLADAVDALEQYYQTVAESGSFKALRHAPVSAFERYREAAPWNFGGAV